MKLINTNISKSTKNLKEIQQNSYYSQRFLCKKMQETKINGNNKHFKCFVNI